MIRRMVQVLLPLVLLGAVACGQGTSPSAPPETPASPATAAAPGSGGAEAPEGPTAGRPAAGARLEMVRYPTGNLDLVIVAREPGKKYEVLDGMGRPLATVKVSEDRVKVRDAQDREVRKVKRKDNGFEVEDGGGARLFRVKFKGGGDFKISDGSDAPQGKIKDKSGKYRVEDAAGKVLGRVKAQGNDVVFEAEDGTETGLLKNCSNARAAAWLALPAMDPTTQAAVVVYCLEGI